MDAAQPNLPAQRSADANFALINVWRTLRKYWVFSLGTALTVCLIVVFYTLGQKKIYQATATIQLDPHPPRPLGSSVETVLDMGAGSFWNNREYYETQYKIIVSMRIALAVTRDLDLNHDGAFLQNLPAGSPAQRADVSVEDAATILRLRLTVEPIKESRLANVRFDDADPVRAQNILATLIDTYVQENLDDALVSTTSAADWLRQQSDKLKVDLESSEMALHDYKLNKNILSVAFDDQSNMLREEMKELNDTLTSVRAKREELTARRNELMKVSSDSVVDLPATELLQSVLLQSLRQRYEDAVRERDGLLGSGKGSTHPEVQSAEAKVAASRTALLAEVRNIQGAVERDVTVVRQQEGGLAGIFDRAKTQALDLNLLEIQYNRLKRSKDNTEKLYSLVLEKLKESDLTRMMRVNNIHVIDRPLVPKVPIRPRVLVNIAFGIAAGIVLGIGAAIGRALLDRTVKTPDDVEADLRLPFLGLLPEMDEFPRKAKKGRKRKSENGAKRHAPELFAHEHPSSGLAEASRAIRTNLMFMAPDHPYRTLLITSAGPSEGKTTVACCIAIAMAQAGQRVVLVDCDLRRPRLHRIFEKSSDGGVTNALLGTVELKDEEMRTEIPNLYVLPSGPIPPNPAELFHSDRFKTLLKTLSSRFDRVIIDSPPVVAVTDAAILSTLCDGALMVVRSFATTKDFARHGARALMDVGGKIAGVVLNAVNLDRQEYRYYYYYYRRGEYYQPTANDRSGDQATAPPN